MLIRKLKREKINEVYTIDRSEVIENIYYLQNGKLVLQPEYHNMQGWPAGEIEQNLPVLYHCFDRGGMFYGAYQNKKLIGVVVLDNKFIGKRKDKLQLKFLHISRTFRKNGVGKNLFYKAAEKAKNMNARKMYISATPSENTINFYLNLGCRITQEIDPELLKLEPLDIHLEYVIQ